VYQYTSRPERYLMQDELRSLPVLFIINVAENGVARLNLSNAQIVTGLLPVDTEVFST
jgi:hypothetical protein